MKKILPFVILIQTVSVSIAFSQTAAETKPASDACPSWNKKPVADKADYFAYLSKRPKKQAATDFSTPRYYNFNAVPTTAASSQKRKARGTTENTEVVQTNTPAIIYGKQPQPEVPAETPAPGISTPAPVVTENKQIPVAVVKEKEHVTAPVIEDKKEVTEETAAPAKEKGVSATAKKEEKHIDLPKKTAQKHTEKHRIKKISFRRKSAAKCPKF
jgi:hypothetical protein